MTRFVQSRLIWGCVGLILLTQAGCTRLPKSGNLSYEEAREELVRLVDAAVKTNVKPDLLPLPEADPAERCNSENESSPEFSSSYGYFFPVDLLTNDESFVDSTEMLWREADLRIEEDNATPHLTSSFAVGRGFNLKVFINDDSGMAYVGGSGPCLVPPSPPY